MFSRDLLGAVLMGRRTLTAGHADWKVHFSPEGTGPASLDEQLHEDYRSTSRGRRCSSTSSCRVNHSFACDSVGHLPAAKDYGNFRMYGFVAPHSSSSP